MVSARHAPPNELADERSEKILGTNRIFVSVAHWRTTIRQQHLVRDGTFSKKTSFLTKIFNNQLRYHFVDVTTFFLRSRTGRRYKNSQQCVILFRPGSSLTNPVSILSEYKESPKHVQSSLGAHTCRQHCARKMTLELWSLEPNPLNKGSEESRDKMSRLSHKQEKGSTSSGQVAEMAKCSRPSHPILHANVVLQHAYPKL